MPEHDNNTPDANIPPGEQHPPAQTEASIDASIEEQVAAARAESQPFDELTLSEAMAVFLRAPRQTWTAFNAVTRPRRHNSPDTPITVPQPRVASVSGVGASSTMAAESEAVVQPARNRLGDRIMLQLGLWLMALLVAWWGVGMMRLRDETSLSVGFLLFAVAGLIWCVGVVAGDWDDLVAWWQARDQWLLPEITARAGALLVMLLGLYFLFDAMDEPIEEAAYILGLVGRGVGLVLLACIAWVVIDVVFRRFRAQPHKNTDE
jgi:hypothetical protein